MVGLREEKKARTRAELAAAASDLFGRHGYAAVTMAQVAAAAGVADQTLYNYFPTKEGLVFDQAGLLESTLIETVVGNPAGPVAAFNTWLDAFLLGEAAHRALAHPGGMPRLVAHNAGLHRMLLAFMHATATTLGERLAEVDGMDPVLATTLADAMLAIAVRATEDIGRSTGADDLAAISARATAAVAALQPLAPA